MKNIFIDFERIKNPYCGLGQYSLALGKSLDRLKPDDLNLVYFTPERAQQYFSDSIKFNVTRQYKKYSFNPMGIFLPHNIDLWHITNQDSDYFPFRKNGIKLLTIHDLNFLQNHKKTRIKRRLSILKRKIDSSHHISTISNFVKRELINIYRLPEDSVSVIYNGVNVDINQQKAEPAFETGDYLFTIGQIVSKKNFHVLIKMMNFLPHKNLIIAGQKNNTYAKQIQQMIIDNNLEKRVHLPGPVSEPVKNWLYAHCDAFVFPSLAEGFGLPPIEAMRAGKPVILSTATSLPEIAGSHAYYWENFDAEKMAQRVMSGIKDFHDNHRQEAALEHANGFNWDAAARQYLSLYSKLLVQQDIQTLVGDPDIKRALSTSS